MSIRAGGLYFGLGLVLAVNIGALWLGRSFKVWLAVVVGSACAVVWMLVRKRKADLIRDLKNADKDTQDRVLAELDESDRQEILKQLGRNVP